MFENLTSIKKSNLILEMTARSKKADEGEVKKFYNILLYIILCNFSDNKPTYLPNIGYFTFKYKGDNIIKSEGTHKKRAKVEVEFEPDKKFLTYIGQIVDGTTTDIEKYFENNLRNQLESFLNTKK